MWNVLAFNLLTQREKAQVIIEQVHQKFNIAYYMEMMYARVANDSHVDTITLAK